MSTEMKRQTSRATTGRYFVYILQCADGSLYTGITNDLDKRIAKHLSGAGAAYTRAKKAEKVVYTEIAADRSAAQKREAEIKSWPRVKKLDLVARGAARRRTR